LHALDIFDDCGAIDMVNAAEPNRRQSTHQSTVFPDPAMKGGISQLYNGAGEVEGVRTLSVNP